MTPQIKTVEIAFERPSPFTRQFYHYFVAYESHNISIPMRYALRDRGCEYRVHQKITDNLHEGLDR
jgi:hypothetical protein